ncbi:pilus assembly protein PilM [Paenibacillus sp. WLX1005]|uniref:pilus assembly protein PilM n=1 Tax=Paenibacillus sp. WLX1005 TaxID=3243766 RepID=UPI0039841341
MLQFKSSTHAGLSIEQTGIRYVSLKKKKQWELEQKRFLPLPAGVIVENQIEDADTLGQLLQGWVTKEGLKNKSVSLSIPPSRILVRTMSIPVSSVKQAAQLVQLEVETGMHLPFEDPVYDYIVTSTDADEAHLLVFAAPSQMVKDYVQLFENAGMRIASVEIATTSLSRAVMMEQDLQFTETMLLQINGRVLDMYMFRSGYPVFMRTITLALPENEYYSEEENRQLTEESLGDITSEILRMLNFYQYSLHDGSVRIENIVVTGSDRERTLLEMGLTDALTDLTLSNVNFQSGNGAFRSDAELNDYRMAVGAALSHEGQQTINLLPRTERRKQQSSYVLVGAAAVWVLLMGLTLFGYFDYHARIDAQEQQIQQLTDDNTTAQLELNKLNGNGASGGTSAQAIMNAVIQYKMDVVNVLGQLRSALPAGGAMRNIAFDRSSDIQLTVNVRTLADASAYLIKLRGMGFANGVDINTASRDNTAGATSTSVVPLQLYSVVYTIHLQNPTTAQSSTVAGQTGTTTSGTSSTSAPSTSTTSITTPTSQQETTTTTTTETEGTNGTAN